MQKHANLVDLVKSFPTNIFLQSLASIQKRTSPLKFAHLAEKSENGSVSNLSTKGLTPTSTPAGPKAPCVDAALCEKRHKRREREAGRSGLIIDAVNPSTASVNDRPHLLLVPTLALSQLSNYLTLKG